MFKHPWEDNFYAQTNTTGSGVLSIECEAAPYEVWQDDDIEVRLQSIKVGPTTLTRADIERLFGPDSVRLEEQRIAQEINDNGGIERVLDPH